MTGQNATPGTSRTPDTPDTPDASGGTERTEEERASSRPFSYPYEERHANVRATRHISREQADAEATPGVPGGYGTTSGGQPGARSGVRPGGDDGSEEAGYADTIAGGAPGSDDTEDEGDKRR
ncbi:hypothetical protein [Streptomyces sp. NPDC003697]